MSELCCQNQSVRNERLREAMAKAGLTETALAAEVEVDAKTVDRWRNEGAVPRRPQVKAKVATILGLDQDELWPPPPPEPPSEDRQVTDEVSVAWSWPIRPAGPRLRERAVVERRE